MKVKDLLEPNPILVNEDCTMGELSKKFQESELKTAIILDGKKVKGMVSIHDVLANIVPYHIRIDPKLADAMPDGYFEKNYKKVKDMPVSQIMTLTTDSLHLEDTAIAAVSQFIEKRRRALPVVDDEGNFAGLITRVVFLKLMAEV